MSSLRAVCPLLLLLAPSARAAWVRVANVTVPARLATGTPAVPAKPLVLSWGGFGCSVPELDSVGAKGGPFALLVERGVCTFDTKMAVAVRAGAAALLVADSLAGEYASGINISVPASEMRLSDPCAVDCGVGRGMVSTVGLDAHMVLSGVLDGSCGAEHGCVSRTCAFSGSGTGEERREVCCLLDQTIDMSLPETVANNTAKPALFLALRDGAALRLHLSGRVTLFDDEEAPEWDWSALVILALGTGTAAIASRLAAEHHLAEDRRRRCEAAAGVAALHDDEVLSMTVGTSLGFLLMASAFLVGLYFLIRAGYAFVMQLLLALFVCAAATSLSSTILHPALRRMPSLRRLVRLAPEYRGSSDGCIGELCTSVSQPFELASLLGLGGGFGVAIAWWWQRRAPWAWAVQDVLAVAIICSFLRTVRLPSLRVASLLLGLMCAYDIFMVFVSPLLFHSSVMMTVATAGEPTAQVSPSGVCERTEAEHMPMLLLVPRLSVPPLPAGAAPQHPPPAFAMLGLGDVVLPGLLLVLARRLDLCLRAKAGGRAAASSYFVSSVVAYAVGLGMALAANSLHLTVNGVQGQPALLYLVPCTLGAVWWRGVQRGEIRALWHGTVLDPPVDAVAADDLVGGTSPGSSESPGDYKPLL